MTGAGDLTGALAHVAAAVQAHRDARLLAWRAVQAQAPGISWRLRALQLSDEVAAFWLCAVQATWNEVPALMIATGRGRLVEDELDRLLRLQPPVWLPLPGADCDGGRLPGAPQGHSSFQVRTTTRRAPLMCSAEPLASCQSSSRGARIQALRSYVR